MFGQWSGTNPVWTNSNVGIGTTSPIGVLQVQSPPATNLVTWLTAPTGNGSYLELGVVGTTVDLQGTPSGDFSLNHYGVVSGVFQSVRAGAVANTLVLKTGKVGIGTANPQYLLSVKGTVGAEEFIVTNTGWSDYVFQPGYRLRPLSEVGAYIQANHHLPDIPSETEVKEKGVSVGEMQSKLLAKVEELTLHMIQADERNNRLEQQNQELRDRLARLEKGAAASATPTAAK
jgi:hypothetical protein